VAGTAVAGTAVAASAGAAGAAGAAVGVGVAHPETKTAIVRINTNRVLKLDFISLSPFGFLIEVVKSDLIIFDLLHLLL
jgi:hypothetical protein